MQTHNRGRGFIVVGLVLLALALVDPLEASLVAIPGVGAVAIGAFLIRSRLRVQAYWAAALLVLGVSTMWILSAFGGLGGSTGRPLWWTVVVVPYPIGSLLGLVTGIRMLRERRQNSGSAVTRISAVRRRHGSEGRGRRT